jgi:hypothetical protein
VRPSIASTRHAVPSTAVLVFGSGSPSSRLEPGPATSLGQVREWQLHTTSANRDRRNVLLLGSSRGLISRGGTFLDSTPEWPNTSAKFSFHSTT